MFDLELGDSRLLKNVCMAHTRCMLDKQGYTYARVCTRPGVRAPTHTQARTHRQIRNIYWFSAATMISERASMLGYTYIACLVVLCYAVCHYALICNLTDVSVNLRHQMCKRN